MRSRLMDMPSWTVFGFLKIPGIGPLEAGVFMSGRKGAVNKGTLNGLIGMPSPAGQNYGAGN